MCVKYLVDWVSRTNAQPDARNTNDNTPSGLYSPRGNKANIATIATRGHSASDRVSINLCALYAEEWRNSEETWLNCAEVFVFSCQFANIQIFKKLDQRSHNKQVGLLQCQEPVSRVKIRGPRKFDLRFYQGLWPLGTPFTNEIKVLWNYIGHHHCSAESF